jgi:hypothetical protein
LIRLAAQVFGLALATALAVAPAAAEQVFDLGTQAPVPGNKTWRDLLAQLFPDLRQERLKDGGIGDFIHGKVDIRPIDKEAFEDYCSDEPLRIKYINYEQVEIDEQMRLIVAITTDGDQCFGALALFSNQLEGRLLDVVNIQQDAHYGYNDDFVRSLGPHARLVIAISFHLTTGGSPTNYVLVLATRDRLSFVGNVAAESEWDCEHHRGIAEQPYVAVAPDYGPLIA